MLTTKSCLEIKKGERSHSWILSPDSPIGECLDVANEFRQYILNVIAQNEEKSKEQSVSKEV